MFGPEYTAGCPSCSAIADGFDGFVAHLENHDVAMNPWGPICRPSCDEAPGMSAFALEDGVPYHTYSAARGLDVLWAMYQWLDRAPRGGTRQGPGGGGTTSTTRAKAKIP